jgi:hypothetical protein
MAHGNSLNWPPKGLSKPALRALASAGYTRLEQLAKIPESEVAGLHGMGPKGLKILRAALAANRLSFAHSKAR